MKLAFIVDDHTGQDEIQIRMIEPVQQPLHDHGPGRLDIRGNGHIINVTHAVLVREPDGDRRALAPVFERVVDQIADQLLQLQVSSPALLLNHMAERYLSTSRILMEFVDNALDDAEALYDGEADAYTYHAAAPIAQGAEVMLQYGARDNASLLLQYGFTLRDNPHGSLPFALSDRGDGRIAGEYTALIAGDYTLSLTLGTLHVKASPAAVRVFRVAPHTFVKLHRGTWHAGPLWPGTDAQRTFYNLELADTNVVDHNTHVFSEVDDIVYDVMD